jgi:hypothetical protein
MLMRSHRLSVFPVLAFTKVQIWYFKKQQNVAQVFSEPYFGGGGAGN